MNLCPDACNITYAVNSLAIAISKNLSSKEIALLSAVLVQLGDTLATISTVCSNCFMKNNDNNIS
ncbi:MAG: hypothetical protein A2Y17_03735 [Clostridiales bacterium GWF2_38_85]|nr:MAG: hypothetical protein A2Y17_03735 [Clostridiales bacterium GWF2_38_85]HBL85320.1 hypothetical protein [Clostridiales bacterium]